MQEPLCARHRVERVPSLVSSGGHPGGVQAAVIPVQQTWTLRLREAGPRVQARTPSGAVRTGLIRAWTLNVEPSSPLSSRDPRVPHGPPLGSLA